MSGWTDARADNWGEGGGWDTVPSRPSGVCKFFLKGGCSYGDSCRHQHPKEHETSISREETQLPATDWWNNESGGQSQKFYKTRHCTYFVQGTCRRGDSCTYIHDKTGKDDTIAKNSTAKPCVFYASGQCNKGDACPFIHSTTSTFPRSPRRPDPVWVDVEPVTSPITPKRSSLIKPVTPTYCQFYANGKCIRGDACPFTHVAASPKFTPDSDSRGVTRPFLHIQGRREQATAAPHEGTEFYRYHGSVPSVRGDESPFQPKFRSIVTTRNVPSICQFFKRGICARGVECPFDHVSAGSTTFPPHSSSPLGSIFPNRDSRQVTGYSDMNGVRHRERNAEGTVQARRVDQWPPKDWPPSPQPEVFSPVHQGPTRVSQPSSVDPRSLGSRPASQAMYKTHSHSSSGRHSVHGEHSRDRHSRQERHSEDQPDEETQVYEEAGLTSKVCDLWEQGSCIQGAACPFLHNDPAWFRAVEEHRNDWNTSWVAPAAPLENVAVDPVDNLCHGDGVTEPEFTVQRTVFHSAVTFGQGAVVRQVNTAFESQTLILSKLPSDTDDEGITELVERFGDVTNVILQRSASSTSARVEFKEYASASQAARHLHLAMFRSVALEARLDLPDGLHVMKTASDVPNQKVKVTWLAPSLVGWAYYPSVSMAKEQADLLKGRLLGGRKISATYQSPRKSQAHSYVVQLKGLPLGTTRDDLLNFCPGNSSINLSAAPIYDRETSTRQIRDLMATVGPIDSFEVLPADASKAKTIAFAQFSCADRAAQAAKDFHRLPLECLGGSRLLVEPVVTVNYKIPALPFAVLRGEIDRLQDAYGQDCKIRYFHQNEEGQPADPVNVLIYGNEPQAMRRAKQAVEDVLSGRLLVLEDDRAWDDILDRPDGPALIRNLNTDTKYFIDFDTRTQTLRYFGPETSVKEAREMILRDLASIRANIHVIPIALEIMRPLLADSWQHLRDDDDVDVSLDVLKRTLTVRGDSLHVKKVKRVLVPLEPSPSYKAGAPGGLCAVCSCEAVNSFRLSCQHSYCEACLGHLARSVTVPNFTPLTCVAETQRDDSPAICDTAIPYDIIRDAISPLEETRLLKFSYLSYLRSRPDEFFYCPTAGCQVVHRRCEPGTILRCPECRIKVCPSCHVEFHDGLTCQEYENRD